MKLKYRRRPQNEQATPEHLYRILSQMYPEKLAAELFEEQMGYAPPQEWRRPEPTLHIFSEDEKHGTTD